MAVTHSVLALAGVLALGVTIASGVEPGGDAAAPASAADAAADTAKVVQGNTAFALDLYRQLAKQEGNLFFSPASIHTALAMTYLGSAGGTADEMAKALHYPLPPDRLAGVYGKLIGQLNRAPEFVNFEPDPQNRDGEWKEVRKPAYDLVVANALWGQKGYPFKDDFTRTAEKSFGAGLNQVGFADPPAAATTINDWVAKQTRDKIQDLVPASALDALTRLVLTNAVYFKSSWAEKFYESNTKDAPFHVSPEQSVDVPLMYQEDEFPYAETDELQVLELPYVRHALSMVILLPREKDGLGALEGALSAEKLDAWRKAATAVQVKVHLPKFTFTSSFDLVEPLQALGMRRAFGGEADFSGMTSAEDLHLTAVLHKAFVAVDEEGTEAAAATAVAAAAEAMPEPQEPKVFRADHPFLFLIRHNATGEVLFWGRVSNPKE